MSAPAGLREDIDAALAACVHCGFCLPACPTYLATADEADSPRGRIVLMRSLARDEHPQLDPSLTHHLDACLGCQGCEPACPSGVAYGHGLEAARALLAARRGLSLRARLILLVFRHARLWRPLLRAARYVRDVGLAAAFGGPGGGFIFGMLASTAPTARGGDGSRTPAPARREATLFRGCVMDELFGHVHDATIEVLGQHGIHVGEQPKQVCCGALHVHAGDVEAARALARLNIAAFGDSGPPIVVNSAGCGAMLKDYAHLLPGNAAAAHFSERVRDVSELLHDRVAASTGEWRGQRQHAMYDAPCHLQHAQRIHDEPLEMLAAVDGLTTVVPPTSSQCCGSAGIFSMLEPAMSRAVLDRKIAEIRSLDPTPDVVLTGNPICMMQPGAGLRAAGLDIPVRHPVEMLLAGPRDPRAG